MELPRLGAAEDRHDLDGTARHSRLWWDAFADTLDGGALHWVGDDLLIGDSAFVGRRHGDFLGIAQLPTRTLGDALWHATREHFCEEEIVELTAIANAICAWSRLAAACGWVAGPHRASA